ncbi:MAG: hypothetical protein JJV92_09525 [Desulfosarcina sp.]|nr:hypothetical protein [Desulfobacterales bacterium]
MSIEIKEMLVKSTVLQPESDREQPFLKVPYDDLMKIKSQIISECKELIIDFFNAQKER